MVLMINATNIRWVLIVIIRICLFNFDMTNCLTVIVTRKEYLKTSLMYFLLIISGNVTWYNYISYYKSVHTIKCFET